jgi:hypothetical protein
MKRWALVVGVLYLLIPLVLTLPVTLLMSTVQPEPAV